MELEATLIKFVVIFFSSIIFIRHINALKKEERRQSRMRAKRLKNLKSELIELELSDNDLEILETLAKFKNQTKNQYLREFIKKEVQKANC